MNINVPINDKKTEDAYYKLRLKLAAKRKTFSEWLREKIKEEVGQK